MMIAKLGNDAPMQMWVTDPNNPDELTTKALAETGAVTTVEFPDGISLIEAFQTITLPGGVVENHFHGAAKPTWVWSDNTALAQLLADQYGITVKAKVD